MPNVAAFQKKADYVYLPKEQEWDLPTAPRDVCISVGSSGMYRRSIPSNTIRIPAELIRQALED